MIIYPYKKFSQSARLLGKFIGARLLYKPRRAKQIINWGRNSPFGKPMLNNPAAVNIASNKLLTFQTLPENICVPWTSNRTVAEGWLKENRSVVVRSLLRASEGRGITIIQPGQGKLPIAPLYTQYIPKRAEFRIHVVGNKVIDIQEKRHKQGQESNQIRSHDNGYVFCRQEMDVPKDAPIFAIQAIRELGLDFGAVDIIWNEKQNRCYVLEVNTAPGLTETTAKNYAAAFKSWFSTNRDRSGNTTVA